MKSKTLGLAAGIAMAAGILTPATTAAAHTYSGTTATTAPSIMREGMLSSSNYPNHCIRHAYFEGELSPCPTRPSPQNRDFIFKAVKVQGHSDLYRLAATNPNLRGHYLRHENYRIVLSKIPPKSNQAAYELFLRDSSFYLRTGLNGKGISFESWNFRGWYIRHSNYHLYIAKRATDRLFKNDATFRSFTVIDYGPELVPVDE